MTMAKPIKCPCCRSKMKEVTKDGKPYLACDVCRMAIGDPDRKPKKVAASG